MLNKFSDESLNVIVKAREESGILQHNHVGCEHLLLGLLHSNDKQLKFVWEKCEVVLEEVRNSLKKIMETSIPFIQRESIVFSPKAIQLFQWAESRSINRNSKYIEPFDLLYVLLEEDISIACSVLKEEYDLTFEMLKRGLHEIEAL